MYGINVKIKSMNGKTAIKKLKAIPPALVVKAPFKIPMLYISTTSYKDIPFKPGILIFFPKDTKTFRIGTFPSLFSISLVINYSILILKSFNNPAIFSLQYFPPFSLL